MNRNALIRLLPACLLALFAVLPDTAALAQSREIGTRGDLLDRIAAVVNEGVVLQSQLDEQVTTITRRLRDQGTQLPPASVLRQQVLERLVLQEIQMQRADRLGIRVSDEMLNGALRNVAAQNKIEFAQLPEVLSSEGLDYAEYRDQLRREMTLSILRQRDVLQRIYVSPREIDQFLSREQNNASETNEYNVSHILVSLPEAASPGQLEQVAARADELYQRALKGEDFGQLAVAFSQAQSALDRGQIGWRKGSELPQFMADVVAGLKPGEVAKPVRTPSGFHIIRLNDLRGANTPRMVEQVHTRHILIKTNELQDDETVRGKLAGLRERIVNGGENFAAIASAVSEDPGSAENGGDLGWTGPGTFVPEFEAEVAKLGENEISPPFRSQYGWHVVQLLGRRTEDTSQEERRKHAFEQIRNSKADEETELWLRRLRAEAYVEYRL
jgi:peptidyl-prolyl cis-trans isomerase SurA